LKAGLVVLCLWVTTASADPVPPEPLKAGSVLDTLTVGEVTYRQVTVKSVSARTVLFLHREGMTSVRLRDLTPGLQTRFGYDPAAEKASERAMQTAIAEREARLARARKAAASARKDQVRSRFDQVLQHFGTEARLHKEVDLRPRFNELALYVKDQGRRPSCSVFAVVSALEYIYADNTGQPIKYSEEYLIWATGRTIQQLGASIQNENSTGEDADTGFALTEVVTALRTYGIPPASSMPNTVGVRNNVVAAPPPEVIAEAQAHTLVAVHLVPGRDNATQLNNIVHALNAGIPVAIGTAWPRFTNMRAALLDTQIPSYGHAITLVGYTCPTGRLQDTKFIFKNSWGVKWGAGGYGFATYAYLQEHLNSAILLELQTSA
ncbi:MAG: C1 family peptidase, partial [Cephaloticoccus sp.]|nr:C1 family peptidase [Cephaloticoccus sp.]